MIFKNFKFCAYILCIFFVSFEAISHGPSRQKVVEKIVINAELSNVWKIVSDFSDFSWNPLITSTDSDGNEIGSLRKITSKNGSNISQTLEKLDEEKKMISWRIKETDQKLLPVNSYQATLILKNQGDKVEATYKAGFYRGFMGNDPPEELNDVNSKKKAKEFVLKSLSGLKKIAEK